MRIVRKHLLTAGMSRAVPEAAPAGWKEARAVTVLAVLRAVKDRTVQARAVTAPAVLRT